MNRDKRIEIAKETITMLKNGSYINNKNTVIDIKNELNFSISNSMLYSPSTTEKIQIEPSEVLNNITIEVTNETTLHAAKRLVYEGFANVVCLNFASAKNPGGGFLNGSQAQEESLARASGLYPCISQMTEMYEFNKRNKTCLYSDYMIYTPKVPVFRDDNDDLLDSPYFVSFITAPAVNAGVVNEREKENIRLISEIMTKRIEKILSIALSHKQDAIVLGAHGCGVFKNNPENVANYFNKLLSSDSRFKNKFKKVVFAVFDRSENQKTYNTFKKMFF